MNSKQSLTDLFFHDLKEYNGNNFKTLESADLSIENPITYKSCSSVVTRFFIFAEHHPEVSEVDLKLLYFQLSIDKIARYFSEYPKASVDDLLPFQIELQRYAKARRKEQINELAD